MDMRQNSGTGAASGPPIEIGPCMDSGGGEYTGLVIGDLTLVKNGTAAAMAANATLTHTSNGHYALVPIGNNFDTLGRWQIRCNKAGYQIPVLSGMVLPATVYDALYVNAAGGANGLALFGSAMILTAAYDAAKTAAQPGDAMALVTGAIAASKIASGAFTSGAFAADAIVAAAIASDAVSKIVAGLATASGLGAATTSILEAVATRLAADDYTEPPTPPDASSIATAVLTKRVADVISGLNDADRHTLAALIMFIQKWVIPAANTYRTQKPDGSTWFDTTFSTADRSAAASFGQS